MTVKGDNPPSWLQAAVPPQLEDEVNLHGGLGIGGVTEQSPKGPERPWFCTLPHGLGRLPLPEPGKPHQPSA